MVSFHDFHKLFSWTCRMPQEGRERLVVQFKSGLYASVPYRRDSTVFSFSYLLINRPKTYGKTRTWECGGDGGNDPGDHDCRTGVRSRNLSSQDVQAQTKGASHACWWGMHLFCIWLWIQCLVSIDLKAHYLIPWYENNNSWFPLDIRIWYSLSLALVEKCK